MSYDVFQAEVLRLVQMKDPKVTALGAETLLSDNLDSLACVELIQAAEENLKIQLSFEEVRSAKTYWSLQDIISLKGYGP